MADRGLLWATGAQSHGGTLGVNMEPAQDYLGLGHLSYTSHLSLARGYSWVGDGRALQLLAISGLS